MKTIQILSCNIRDARAEDGDNNWIQRKNTCIAILRQQQADILCFQEMRLNQQTDLLAALPEYSCYGLAEDANTPDTPNALFFRTAAFSLISQGGYWLSGTPKIPGSRSWDSRYTRLANRVILQASESRYRIDITNTHLEDDNPFAAAQQAHVITRQTPPPPTGTLQILTGDMNSDASSDVIQAFLDAGWLDTDTAVHGAASRCRTFHAFEGERCTAEPSGKIDWIFTRGPVQVLAAEIIRDRMELRYPSDHYFVSATVSYE